MIFSELVKKVELHLRLDSPDIRFIIKDFINESIIDFIRLYAWKNARAVSNITLDDSGQYDLTSVLVDTNLNNLFFAGEIELLNEGGVVFKKYNYSTYLSLPSKVNTYSLLNKTLYVIGNNAILNFIFQTPGYPYPLVNDDDENLITLFYFDIIKLMTIIKVLEWLGDTSDKELQAFQMKILSLKDFENRNDKNGKFKMVLR